MALPKETEHWLLTTLRENVMKIGAKIVTHAHARHQVPRCGLRRIPSATVNIFRVNLSFLTVPTSPCQIVESGLNALEMTSVSYVIQGNVR